jgi:hypothetical protein
MLERRVWKSSLRHPETQIVTSIINYSNTDSCVYTCVEAGDQVFQHFLQKRHKLGAQVHVYSVMTLRHSVATSKIRFRLIKGRVDRAVDQAVRRWLPTVAARVCVQAEHVGFVVDKAALRQVFSEYLGFPCQSFHQFLHHHNHPGLAE